MLAEELREAVGGRIDRIHQPSREEMVFQIRQKGGNCKILISAGASSPRIHLTDTQPENPKVPPMFCMLLRKHLSGAKLAGVRQIGLDRILMLDFETSNEFGDPITLTVVVEIMGRHSNLVLIDAGGRIIDAIKRITEEMSSVRQILPGMQYELPPQPQKLRIDTAPVEEVCRAVKEGKEQPLSKALLGVLEGMSPLVTREISYYVGRGEDLLTTKIDGDLEGRLSFSLGRLAKQVEEHDAHPVILFDPNGKPKDFSYLPIHQYGAAYLTKEVESCSALLDRFYSQRDLMERMKQRSNDLLRLLANTSERILRKIALQREELKECANRDTLKRNADLINANLYQLEKGMNTASLQDFYDPACKMVSVPLDPSLSPAQNAQRYYNEYRKAATAEKMLTDLIEQGEQEYEYIDTVFDALVRATTESELMQIREELSASGYIKNYRFRNKKPEKLTPMKYQSSDGFTILVGRNNLQNDQLTLRDAHNADIWMHTQKIPGSHTVVITENRPVPDRTLEEAAMLAAYHSKAREAKLVPVDYTQIRYVKKPAGARPGKVIYDRFKTAIVTPDKEKIAQIKRI